MPDQISGVTITHHPETQTYDLQMGSNGEQGLSVVALFDRTNFDPDHLIGNIRLKRLIGNYGVLWSQEFVNAINERGVRTRAGDYFNVGFSENVDGSFTISFGSSVGGAASEAITVNPADLFNDTHDLEMVVKNVGAFIRIAGYTDLTTPAPNGVYAGKTAIQAVAEQTFRF